MVLLSSACRKEKNPEAPIKPKTTADYIRPIVGDRKMRGTVYDHWNYSDDTTYEMQLEWYISLAYDTDVVIKMHSGPATVFRLESHDPVLKTLVFYSERTYYSSESITYFYENDNIKYVYSRSHFAAPVSYREVLYSYKWFFLS